MKKSISLVLLAAMLASLAACGSGTADAGNDTTSSAAQSDGMSAADETVPEETLDLPSDLNYDGYVFRIFSRQTPALEQVYAAEENGDKLNDAVYMRNMAVEEKLGVKFLSPEKTGFPSFVEMSVSPVPNIID